MYNFITYWLQLKELTINSNFKSIRLRYIKVISYPAEMVGCHKMKVGIVHFFKSDIYFCKSSIFFNFTGLEKTKEVDVPQNDCEKDAVTGPIAGNFIVCFVN